MSYKSLFDVWKQSYEKYTDLTVFSNNTGSCQLTYREAFLQVCFLAEFISKLGLKRFDHVALFAVNTPQWLIIEQAVITLGGVVVSKSSEINIDELEYVFNNSDSVALITDNSSVVSYLSKNNPAFLDKIKFIIYMGSDEIINNSKIYKLADILSGLNENYQVKTDWEEIPDDIAYINYTSGTSSSPKGAMLPNNGMSYVVEELQKFNDIETGKTFVVTFPLSSAGGKSFNLLCLSKGCRIVYTPYKEFYETIQKFQPDYLHCAPKIIQTMHSKLMAEVKHKSFFNFVYNISYFILNFERKYIYKNKMLFTKKIIDSIKLLLDRKIYKKIRNTLLKDETIVFVGSAHLAKPLEDFLQIMDIKHIQHYGLTETTGLDVSNTLESQKKHPYTVGIPFSKTVLRIINPETGEKMPNGEIGLITLQGVEILKEYYKNKEATEKAILNEHFLNTGDLGYLDKDGYLIVLSRYDDVIVMSNGYNVYTPLLENEVKDSEYIKQIVIAGHGKPYLTAIISLNNDKYKEWCSQNNTTGNIEPNENKKFKEFLIEHLNEKIKRKNNHKYYEKLKNIWFINDEFTFENGLLTGTLKLKYKKVINKYQKEIDRMYEDK